MKSTNTVSTTDLYALAVIAQNLRNDSNGPIGKDDEKVLDYTRRKTLKAMVALDQEIIALGEKVCRLEKALNETFETSKTATPKTANAIQAALRRVRNEYKTAKAEYRQKTERYREMKDKVGRIESLRKAA